VDVSKLWPDQDAIHSTLEKIFARDEFQDKPKRWPDLALEWFRDFFRWLGTLYEHSNWLFWVLLILSLAVLCFLLWHIASTVYRVFYHEHSRRGAKDHSQLRRQLSMQYLHDAEQHAIAREYTEAIRHLFLSLVYFYDEKDEFIFRPALTNHEYLQGFIRQAALHQELSRFVQTLDDRWYGMRPCSEIDYQDYRTAYDHLVQGRRKL
jgi:hypothetical protein